MEGKLCYGRENAFRDPAQGWGEHGLSLPRGVLSWARKMQAAKKRCGISARLIFIMILSTVHQRADSSPGIGREQPNAQRRRYESDMITVSWEQEPVCPFGGAP